MGLLSPLTYAQEPQHMSSLVGVFGSITRRSDVPSTRWCRPRRGRCSNDIVLSHLVLQSALILDQMTKKKCSAYKQHTRHVFEPPGALERPGQAGSCLRPHSFVLAMLRPLDPSLEGPQMKGDRERMLGFPPGEEKRERGQMNVTETETEWFLVPIMISSSEQKNRHVLIPMRLLLG